MLTEVYIEALLAKEELADQVWQASVDGALSSAEARIAWLIIVGSAAVNGYHDSF